MVVRLHVALRVRGARGGARVPEEQRWAPLATVFQGRGAVLASCSAQLLQAIPRVGSSESEMRSQRERRKVRAAIQLFAAGDPAHAGVVPYMACRLMQVVRNLPRFEKNGVENWIVAIFQYQ